MVNLEDNSKLFFRYKGSTSFDGNAFNGFKTCSCYEIRI